MAHHDFHLTGAPCWADVISHDPDKAVAFYTGLLGWEAHGSDDEHGDYVMFTREGRNVAGCARIHEASSLPDHWAIYLATDDARVTADTAADNGGQVLVGPMPVGEMGHMAMLADPGRAPVGIWQPERHAGFELLGVPGAPTWFELHTRSYQLTVEFYRSVFGWDTHTASDTPDFRYTTLGEGDDARAGIMDASGFLPEDAPATWLVYFEVDDLDAALAKVTELGGTVVSQPDDSPYGRLGGAADPTGALFKLRSRS